MPLFSKQVKIEKLSLDGLTVNLVTDKQGQTSFTGLSKTDSKPTTTEPAANSSDVSTQPALDQLDIGGISVTNAQVNVINQQTNTKQEFDLNSLTLGRFSLGKFADLQYQYTATLPDMKISGNGKGQVKLAADFGLLTLKDIVLNNDVAGASIPNQQLATSITTNIAINLKKQQLSMNLASLAVGSITGDGNVDIDYGAKVPSINAKLALGDINLNEFMPKASTTESATTTPQNTASNAPEVEPDLSGMKAVNAKFNLTVKSINIDKLKTENWAMQLNLHNGVLDMKSLTADLYQGKLVASASLDGRNKVASYRFNEKLSGVQVRQLLKDAADIDILSGAVEFDVSGNGRSLIPSKLKQNLIAKGDFAVTDGSLYGVNIPQMIREAKEKLKGNFEAAKSEEKKTDFTSLTGSFNMAKGVVNNPDLAMQSPLIRLDGAGDANIIDQSLNYKLTTVIVGSFKGQGGDEDLKGIKIPLVISGTFSEPKYALDTEAMFKGKIDQELDKAKDKLKDKLLKGLGNW